MCHSIGKPGPQRKAIRYSFYEKPSASPTVFLGRGKTSTRKKIATLADEVKRRLVNQDRWHSQKEKLEEIRKFCKKLID